MRKRLQTLYRIYYSLLYSVDKICIIVCVGNLCRALIFGGRMLHNGTIVASYFCANSVLSCLFLCILGVTLKASYSRRFEGLWRGSFGFAFRIFQCFREQGCYYICN